MTGLELVIPAIGAGAAVVNAGYNVVKGQGNNGNGASGKPAKVSGDRIGRQKATSAAGHLEG